MNRSFKMTSLISSLILVVVAGFVYLNSEKLKSSADIQLQGGTIESKLTQRAKFSGTVTNAKTGELVKQAQISVSLTTSNYSNIGGTGLTGNYESSDTYEVGKSYYLKATAIGFQEFTTIVTTKDGTNSVNFSLKPQMDGGSTDR